MKVIVEKDTNVSIVIFEDNDSVTLTDKKLTGSDSYGNQYIYSSVNSSNAVLYQSVTTPDDWYGCKYNYIDGNWELCPDWVDPRTQEV